MPNTLHISASEAAAIIAGAAAAAERLALSPARAAFIQAAGDRVLDAHPGTRSHYCAEHSTTGIDAAVEAEAEAADEWDRLAAEIARYPGLSVADAIAEIFEARLVTDDEQVVFAAMEAADAQQVTL